MFVSFVCVSNCSRLAAGEKAMEAQVRVILNSDVMSNNTSWVGNLHLPFPNRLSAEDPEDSQGLAIQSE